MRTRHGYLAFGLVLVLVLVVAAGCGGGASPPVASLGDSATTTTSGGGDPAGSSSSSGNGAGGAQSLEIAGGNPLKFSQCMRAHGVSNFPDPNGQGVIHLDPNSGIDTSSSTFRSAAQACRRLVPGGHLTPSPAQQAKFRREALAFSACMRKHGVPDFPDPTFTNGSLTVKITAQPGSDLNPNSPTFQAAQQACQGLLPFKPHASSNSGGAK